MAYRCVYETGAPWPDTPWYEYPLAYAYCTYQYNTAERWGRDIAHAGANVYERVQYGKIPAPGAGLPRPPGAGPAADTPAGQAANDAAAFDGWVDDSRRAIQDAEDDGSYIPSGRLPFDADWNPTGATGWWILGAAAVLGAVVIAKR